MKPYSEIKTATKELVDFLLSLNTNNRSMKAKTVERYSKEIREGRWRLTNQGIGVSSENVLIDGQHRLEAIKKSLYPPVPILIVWGLQPDSQIAVDSHAKRSARDMLHFAFGYRVSRSAPAIGNVLFKCQRDWGLAPSNFELMEIIQEFSEEIEAITEIPQNANYFSAPFLAAFVKTLKENPANFQEIKGFMNTVESGEMLDKSMPAYHLRNFVFSSKKTSGGSQMQKERFFKAMKAVNSALLGEKMGVLRA